MIVVVTLPDFAPDINAAAAAAATIAVALTAMTNSHAC